MPSSDENFTNAQLVDVMDYCAQKVDQMHCEDPVAAFLDLMSELCGDVVFTRDDLMTAMREIRRNSTQ